MLKSLKENTYIDNLEGLKMLKIYVTNLGKYNEGFLIGKWLELPATEEEIEKTLEAIGISDEPDENGIYYEEYFITDYETDMDGLKVSEYSNIDDLNELAETIDDLDEDEKEIVNAIMGEGYSLEDAIDKKDDVMIYSNCSNMTEVAEEYAEQVGLLESIPENLRYYFDFEAYGRDMSFEGHFVFTDNGNCIQIF